MKMNKLVSLLMTLSTLSAFAATPQVKNMKAFQQYPWSGKVCIAYEVEGRVATSTGGTAPFLFVTAKDKTTGLLYGAVSSHERYLSGDVGTTAGQHKIFWDIEAQGITVNSTKVVFTVVYCDAEQYLVIDLSSGADSSSYPVSYLYAVPSGGWSDTYKTTKLVLRRIMPGSFKMCGSYKVTITKPFYIGVFEVTQKQYVQVMGTNPSYRTGDTRPVEMVSYNMIRGSEIVADWPTTSSVSLTSFMGKLRERTGLNFDLPTEAQWEYACRAGTTSNYNNGGNSASDLSLLGRYLNNRSDGKGGYSNSFTAVGSYIPNAWGLYDMHGNVWEFCLDWYGDLAGNVVDPTGVWHGTERVVRGGCWNFHQDLCTSSYRDRRSPSLADNYGGFRIVRTLSD